MNIYIKNTDTVNRTWSGQEISPSSYYLIEQSELSNWQNNSTLLSDIGSGVAAVAKSNDGLSDIVDVAEAINHLIGISVTVVKQPQSSPFAQKEIDGKKLYKRVRGVVIDCVEGENAFDLVVPYDTAKLNQIDVLWANEGCTVDFKVYDTPTGAISVNLAATNYTAIPNLMLNQFGFGAGVAKDHFKQHSEYDADVIKDMKLQAVITVPVGGAKKICVNFILNETK